MHFIVHKPKKAPVFCLVPPVTRFSYISLDGSAGCNLCSSVRGDGITVMEFSLKVFVTAALQGTANLPPPTPTIPITPTPASSYLELNKQNKMEGRICWRHIQHAMISNLPFLNASALLRAHPCQKEDRNLHKA